MHRESVWNSGGEHVPPRPVPVAHDASANRARRRVTSLMRRTTLPLCQTTNDVYLYRRCIYEVDRPQWSGQQHWVVRRARRCGRWLLSQLCRRRPPHCPGHRHVSTHTHTHTHTDQTLQLTHFTFHVPIDNNNYRSFTEVPAMISWYWRTTTPVYTGPLFRTTPVSQYQNGKPMWIYWSKRQWVAVASAGLPCTSLHLAADR